MTRLSGVHCLLLFTHVYDVTTSKAPTDGLQSEGSATSDGQVATFNALWDKGMTPEYCADQLFEHVRDGKFYCLLDNVWGKVSAGMTDETIARRYNSMTQRVIIPSAKGGLAQYAKL
jgi:hypothetical protein